MPDTFYEVWKVTERNYSRTAAAKYTAGRCENAISAAADAEKFAKTLDYNIRFTTVGAWASRS